MISVRLSVLLSLLFVAPAFAEHPMLRSSGLPIPRFVSLKFDEVNLRAGPGRDYPIKWVLRRKHYPVEVIEEFGHWRKIKDREETIGWVYHTQLSGLRFAYVLASENFTLIPLYAAPDSSSRLVMEAETGAMLQLTQCNGEWCEATINERNGWLDQSLLWGVYSGETFED